MRAGLAPALLLAHLAGPSAIPASQPEPRQGHRIVRDATGADVAIPVQPRRVACLAPDLTDLAFALGAGDAVVGTCEGCELPPGTAPRARLGSMASPSVEAILLLGPDLVLATSEGNPLTVVERLRALGVPVVGLAPAPGLAGNAAHVRRVGDLLARAQPAEEIALRGEREIAEVRARRAGQPRRRACILVWTAPLVAAGRDTYLTELADAAGADNACGIRDGWPTISREELLLAAPEIVLLATGPGGAGDLGSWAAAVPAVRNGAVLRLPERPFLRPAAGLAGAAPMLERLLHSQEGAPR